MKAAQMYAAGAIQKRNESKRYQTLAFKIDAVHGRLKNASQTQKVILLKIKILCEKLFLIYFFF